MTPRSMSTCWVSNVEERRRLHTTWEAEDVKSRVPHRFSHSETNSDHVLASVARGVIRVIGGLDWLPKQIQCDSTRQSLAQCYGTALGA